MEIIDIFEMLLNKRHEGPYWDFKQEWCPKENKDDLYHDIICMANNLVDSDAYLFYGISDSFEIIGVENDKNRRNTQKLVDGLKDLKFLGDVHPMVHVDTFEYNSHLIDVIVIENSNNTPFILREQYKGIFPNHIYTRVQDTNTPKKSSADLDKQELLWKKRFGINKTIMEKMLLVLDDYSNWGSYDKKGNFGLDLGNTNVIFNKFFPEFRIEIDKENENIWDMETMACFYPNLRSGDYNANIYYFNTVIFNIHIAHVDEFNKYIVIPQDGSIEINNKAIYFYYLLKNSISGKIQRILTQNTFDTSSRFVGKYWLLYFDDENDYDNFICFAKEEEQLVVSNISNGEYFIGEERQMGQPAKPMSGINNVYRIYIEYLIKKKNINISKFSDYFKHYKNLISKK